MIGRRGGHLASKLKSGVFGTVALSVCVLAANAAIAAPAGSDAAAASQMTPEVRRLLDDADKALAGENFNLAMIQLKNAVRLAPKNGEVRVRLGTMLMRGGQPAAAERELRQAMADNASPDLVVPQLLGAMLQRNETKEVLAQFPEPPQGTQENTAADVLNARAIALQTAGKTAEARAAMNRSLGIRRDGIGLLTSARLAQAQGDLTLARSQTDEAIKLSPTNEAAFVLDVLLKRQTGENQKALEAADDFIKRVPASTLAKVMRIESLLELKQGDRAAQEVAVLLKQSPNSIYGQYYRGVLMAQDKNYKGAWQLMQSLPPEFVQSQPSVTLMVARVAVASGNAESGGAILTTFLAHYPDVRDARLQLASIRLSQNAPSAVVDALTPLKGSKDPDVHSLLAQGYLRLRRFDEAIASLEIANSSPNANDALKRQLALSQLQVGDSDQAIQGLQDLVKRDPGNPQLAIPLISALVNSGKWDAALSVTDAMAKKTPKSPLPPFFQGQILAARGNLSGAVTSFDKALTFDPKFTPALYYRASVSVARGDTEDAKKNLQQVLAQSPTNVLAYIKLSDIALDSGQDQEVVPLLNRAIKAAPDDPTPRLALARFQINQGKYPDAQATIDGLLQVSRNNPEGLALQGQVQFARGQASDAVKTFRGLAAANANSAAAYMLLAKALYLTKDQLAAENTAKRAIELDSASMQMRQDLIDIQIGANKGENAVTTARAYASSYPRPAADLLVANTLIRVNRTNEAEALLNKSFSAKPDPAVALRLSQIAASSGNAKKGIAILASWVAKNPNDFALRAEYAAAMMGSGDLAGARNEYESLLKLHPEDPIILNNLGWVIQKDNPDRALSLVSLAAKIAPRSPQITDTLGWMKYQRRDQQGALPLLQRAHAIDANNAPISYHLAVVLDATGKRADAKSLLRATLAKYPKFDGADDARKTLAGW